jgi:RimJ/RimL family protein N-acetyltransferase
MDHPDPWPLRHLVLRTPRLELRPDDDEGLLELVEVAYGGVHDPATMPFLVPWTDADPAHLGRGALQYYWQQRAQLGPQRWGLHFLIRHEGRVIGVQGMLAEEFAPLRTVDTGSWLGLPHQRRGFGTEMRAAVLQFAFDWLGAREATSGAFSDNVASLTVSERLGYRRNGTRTLLRRGRPATEILFRLTPRYFVRPDWKLQVEGVEECLGLLGAC